ncbi:hypothetical protein IWW56_002741 [Coemansia sp. RSA 2131]|nr:hypothetical protein IWW56_002741 [Coemansia sp. RSA 2131]
MRRRQMGPMYSMPTVRLLEDSVIETGALSLMAEWDKQVGQDAVNYFYGFHGVAVDIIGVLGFGQSFNIAQTGDSRIIDGMHKFVALVVMRSCFRLLHQFPWIAKPFNDGRLYVTRVANAAIAKRHKENALGVKHIDILQKLIDARDSATGAQIEGKHLTSEILLLLIAGTDTTSNTLTWTLMHLLHHPHILQQVQHDIRHMFPDMSTPIRFEEAREHLPYLTAILYESMRLHSAVSGYLPRTVPHTGATLDSYYLPPTTEICVSLAACHRNKNTWPHPDRFIPERFMGPDAELRKRDVLAFGSGVRMCAGRNLAWIELYTLLANVLRRYDFELPKSALYGPLRMAENGSGPECIPGLSFTTFGPANPSRDCNVKISLAPTC